eukprot:gene4453-8873_t
MGTLLEKYDKLRERVEELKNERDSYREAMMKVFEEANPANTNTNGNGSGKVVPGSGHNGGSTNPKLSITTTSTSESAMKNMTALSGFMNSNRQLQEHIAQLTRQNHELKQLERLRPHLMELQQRVAVMQEESFKSRVKFVEETSVLTETNQELQLQLKACNRSLDGMAAELADARAYAETMSQRAEELLSREMQLRSELEHEKKTVQDVVARSVDPAKLVELEEQLSEALDMQRMMGLAADLVQLKEENERVQHRLEEVETEKSAFKQAMQKAMAEKNPPTPPYFNPPGKSTNSWAMRGSGGSRFIFSRIFQDSYFCGMPISNNIDLSDTFR